jgi:hypothetical protein
MTGKIPRNRRFNLYSFGFRAHIITHFKILVIYYDRIFVDLKL